jgi:hypothetical protein
MEASNVQQLTFSALSSSSPSRRVAPGSGIVQVRGLRQHLCPVHDGALHADQRRDEYGVLLVRCENWTLHRHNTLPQRGRKPRGDADHLALLPGQDLCRLHQRLALGLVFRHAVHRRQEGCEQGHLPCQVVSGEGSYLMITESYNASTLHQWPLFFGDGRGVQADHGLPQNQQAEAVRTQGPERGEVTGLI